jgi:hypothetical protein
MQGDFTRWTFDPSEQFTRVLQQQGRVQLDADWNEQAAILLHFLRTLAEDLIGPFGAPPNADGTPGIGFRLENVLDPQGKAETFGFRLRKGRYYVGGLPVENPKDRGYNQNDARKLPGMGKAGTWLLYLDVWERFLTYVQDDRIREKALGGADTAARARLVWQVRAVTDQTWTVETSCLQVRKVWSAWVEKWRPANRGRLQAQAKRPDPSDDPCVAAPDARYTGENQLYRVEIHKGGTVAEGATFKWSRENGSVVFPIRGWTLSADGKAATLTLEHLGRDRRFGLQKGSWVEALDDDAEESGRSLLLVNAVENDRLQVTLQVDPAVLGELDPAKHPFLRRWDQGQAAPAAGLPVKEGGWLDLEDGIQISFTPAADGEDAHRYLLGDYWEIPARSATGDVEWPRGKETKDGKEVEVAKSLPPLGVEHRFAPLGLVTISDGVVTVKDCRRTFGERALVLDTGWAGWSLVAAKDRNGKSIPGLGTLPRTAAIIEDPHRDWSQALLPARWISAQTTGEANPGNYTFRLSFHLAAGSRNAMLSLSLLGHNSATVSLNDKPLGAADGFTEDQVFRFETDDPERFVAGDNSLTVVVKNDGGPMGFVLAGRVDVDGKLCC